MDQARCDAGVLDVEAELHDGGALRPREHVLLPGILPTVLSIRVVGRRRLLGL